MYAISIHALREEGDVTALFRVGGKAGISIHALREEGDEEQLDKEYHRSIFLSTPSARRATGYYQSGEHGAGISIHALREDGDVKWWRLTRRWRRFLSTPSARRATNDFCV